MSAHHLASAGPDFGAVGGSSQLRSIVGALLTYELMVAVLMAVVCAATWAIGSAHGSWQTASKAKAGLFAALGGAALTGGALAAPPRRARSRGARCPEIPAARIRTTRPAPPSRPMPS